MKKIFQKVIRLILCSSVIGIFCIGCQQDDEITKNQITLKDATITLPESWTDQYSTEQTDSSVTVYHKASKEKWEEKGESETGVLFTLNYSEDTDYTALPSYDDLGKSKDGGYYYLTYPTDVQAYVLDSDIQKEYDAMYADIDSIKENAEID